MSQSAPAKLILCGEHAVVYGRPAIALPLAGIRARAACGPAANGSGLQLAAPDLGRAWAVRAQLDDPLSALALATLAQLGAPEPDLVITIHSDIPIASGMGSGAAVATALVRALAAYTGRTLAPEQVSALVYASEQRLHGTPSGIDNSVVAYEQPVWFQRTPDDRPQTTDHRSVIEPIRIAAPFTLVIGDTGVRSATRLPVGEVRRRWQAEPERYEALFDQVGALVAQVRVALAAGDTGALGPLLNANQELLEVIGVSSPELEQLVAAAREAGSPGAKLSGAGWGGVMLALAPASGPAAIAQALQLAGAAQVLVTTIDDRR